jgi:hypothetical protein
VYCNYDVDRGVVPFIAKAGISSSHYWLRNFSIGSFLKHLMHFYSNGSLSIYLTRLTKEFSVIRGNESIKIENRPRFIIFINVFVLTVIFEPCVCCNLKRFIGLENPTHLIFHSFQTIN